MPSALLKQSKVRLRRRFLASAKLERVRLCPRLIENVLRFLTLRRRGRPLSEIASAAGRADACEYCSSQDCAGRSLAALRPASVRECSLAPSAGCGPNNYPPPQPPKINFTRNHPPATRTTAELNIKKLPDRRRAASYCLRENTTSCRTPPNPYAGACP